jgi:uncharacterized membrane protein
MTHAEFVAAYREGKLTVHVDAKAAARLVSSQMMLPLVLLPCFGLAVGLALIGQLVWGFAVFVLAFGFRYFVRSSARGFVLTRSLQDPAFYQRAVEAGILRL